MISLDKQIFIYSVDTSFFYNEIEMKIHRKLNKTYRFRNKLKKLQEKNKDEHLKEKLKLHISRSSKRANKLKEDLYKLFSLNTEIRNLNDTVLHKRNIISVFDSVLTRTLDIPENTISKDIFVVQTYFFDVLEDIILHGFFYNGDKYVCFTASAGQIRTKKTVFIKESVLEKHQYSLMCGLSIERINELGGVNINKYLAYLALCNSATDEWKEFDINKAIVVDDMETTVRSLVDFIDDKTYEITRQDMDIPITHTDGCGMILPRKNKKSMMIRLPWIKGLLVPFPFDKFIREVNRNNPEQKIGVVTDIYGKQHDIIKDNVEVILTKSQFKMWKYYSSWDEYKEKYLQFNCQAGKCNEEEDVFGNAKLNYQMLQTLNDMTDDELKKISTYTANNIMKIGKDRETMLKVLGVTESNTSKNYIQQALEIYPELLSDTYSKEILKQVKKSMVKEARSGKLDVNGKYTFICPDLYAFCEYLFVGNKNPKGLLGNGEIYCDLYKQENKLDCLRSPHLYREHAVRHNIVNKEKGRWFVTHGLYTSVHDPISKILMFDVDGDKALCVANKTIIEVAERTMKDIVPLFYNMAVAGKEQVDNKSIYHGLKAAYSGGNIGMISNDITKIWNSGNVNLDVIKWLCMLSNFTIDYAKTLYKPVRPKHIGKLITKYTKSKTPHFFIYAKNKKPKEVEKINNSLVNKLQKIIPNPMIKFKSDSLGKFDYNVLMSKDGVELDQGLISKYTELDLNKRFVEIEQSKSNKSGDNIYIYKDIRNQLLSINTDINYVVDVLVQYLYNDKISSHKTTLWSSFGDVIVENLHRNLDKYGNCVDCGIEFVSKQAKRYCDNCANKRKIESKKAYKNNKKMEKK